MKYKIELLPLADHYVAAVRDINTSKIKESFTLNEIGADILKLLAQDTDTTIVVQEIATKYEAPIDLITKDVLTFEKNLKKKGLL